MAAPAPATEKPLNRNQFDEVIARRFFIRPSFEIYNGVAGLYDLGPPSCALQANILDLWRKFFVLEEQMLELDSTIMTKSDVFITSGHVERFTDLMVKDLVTGECLRADHLLEQVLSKRMEDANISKEKKEEYETIIKKIDDCGQPDLSKLFKDHDVKSPAGNALSEPFPFNLMFGTMIGPHGNLQGYLRPETAQGMFVNFKFLLDYNGGRMPFAAAQIGRAFRNEIAPRAGLLRVREFTMAEIEHFVNPNDKSHPKFKNVENITVNLLPAPPKGSETRTPIRETIGNAVRNGLINNETLGYFMGRIYLFMLAIGINELKMRFRQHGPNEMAHYASDCWDCEIQNSYGWIECVGCADRSCYDLEHHEKVTQKGLYAQERLKEPITVETISIEPNMGELGKSFRQKSQNIKTKLNSFSEHEVLKFEADLKANGKVDVTADGETYTLTPNLVKIKKTSKKKDFKEFTPAVIEPSFGIGRILYSLLEHSFWNRPEDEQRTVFSFKPRMAPVKVLLAPLSNRPEFEPFLEEISQELRNESIAYKIDDSASAIGRRYARADELGIPFGITIDFQTVKDRTITIRERDSTKQIRVALSEFTGILSSIINEKQTWADVQQKYPEHTQQDA